MPNMCLRPFKYACILPSRIGAPFACISLILMSYILDEPCV